MKIADAKISDALAVPAAKTRTRRTYSQQFKRDVASRCMAPGASVSAIALSHGINANVIRKWLPARSSPNALGMLPVTIEPDPEAEGRQPTEPVPARAAIELDLAGATLRLPPGFDVKELRSIVQILATLK
jgi:transposase